MRVVVYSERICNDLAFCVLDLGSRAEPALGRRVFHNSSHVVALKVSRNQQLGLNIRGRLDDARRREDGVLVVEQLNLVLRKFVSNDRSVDIQGIPLNTFVFVLVLDLGLWESW